MSNVLIKRGTPKQGIGTNLEEAEAGGSLKSRSSKPVWTI